MPPCPCCSNHTELLSGGCDRSRFLYFPLCQLVCFSIAVSQLLCLAFMGFKCMPLLQIQKHSGSVRAHSHRAKDKTERFHTEGHQSSHTQKILVLKNFSWTGREGQERSQRKDYLCSCTQKIQCGWKPTIFLLAWIHAHLHALQKKDFFVLSLALCKCSWCEALCVVVFSDNIYSYKVTLHSPALTDLFPRMPGVTPKLTLQPELIIAK